MTRKELDKYFSGSEWDELRADLNAVMDAHPEITDHVMIELAAGKIEECRDDGVELSVENAYRLVKNTKVPTTKELVESLRNVGITDDDVGDLLDTILNMKVPAPTGETPKAPAQAQAQVLTQCATELAQGNPDIVLLGVPDIDPGWDFAQLKMAFLCKHLTENETKLITNMKSVADESKFYIEDGIGYTIFYINSL